MTRRKKKAQVRLKSPARLQRIAVPARCFHNEQDLKFELLLVEASPQMIDEIPLARVGKDNLARNRPRSAR